MNIFKNILKQQWLLVFAFFFLIFLFFASSTPRTNVGFKDSDEFIIVANEWGVAHPPGYILYTTTLKAAMSLPIPYTTITQRAHLVSSLSFVISLFFLLKTLQLISIHLYPSQKKQLHFIPLITAIATILLVATARLPWLNAQIVQKNIFSFPFLALILYLTVRIFQKKFSLNHVLILGFTYGLLLTHQQSMLLLLPMITYAILHSKVSSLKQLGLLVASIAIGYLLPLGLLLYRIQANSQYSWPVESSLSGLITFLTQTDITHHLTAIDPQSGFQMPKQSISNSWNGLIHYLQIVVSSFSWWVILPIVVSGIVLWKKARALAVLLVLPLLLLGFGVAVYFGWNSDLSAQATISQFYLPSFILSAPFIFIGLCELLLRLQRSAQILGAKPKISLITLSSLLFLIPGYIVMRNYKSISLKSFTTVSSVYSSILNQLEQNSLITCYTDSSCFALEYEQRVNGNRSDVTIVSLAYPYTKSHKSHELKGFSYTQNPFLLFDIVTWNLDKRPVYAVNLSAQYSDMFGIDQGLLFYIPNGHVVKLSKQMPQELPESDISLSKSISYHPIPAFDYNRRMIIQKIAEAHISNAYLYLKAGLRERAKTELNTAMNIAYTLPSSDIAYAHEARNNVERTLQEENFKPGSSIPTAKKLLEYLPNFYKGRKLSSAYRVIRGALISDPKNIEARLELARFFEKIEDYTSMQREYQHILLLDAQNAEANQKLSQ